MQFRPIFTVYFNYSEDGDDKFEDAKTSKVDEYVDVSSIRSKLQKTKKTDEFQATKSKKENEDTFDDEDEELTAQKKKRDEIKREIMELQREMKGMKDKKANQNKDLTNIEKEPEINEPEQKNDMLFSFHQEQKKYATKKLPQKGASREAQTMALLAKFKEKLGTCNIRKKRNRIV